MSTYGVWVEILVEVDAETHEQAEQMALDGVQSKYEIEDRTVTCSSERSAA